MKKNKYKNLSNAELAIKMRILEKKLALGRLKHILESPLPNDGYNFEHLQRRIAHQIKVTQDDIIELLEKDDNSK